eukprot:tig00000802_g4307.t1
MGVGVKPPQENWDAIRAWPWDVERGRRTHAKFMLGQLVKLRARKFGEGWIVLSVIAFIFSLCAITTRDWGVLEKYRSPELQTIMYQPKQLALLETVIHLYAGLQGIEYRINQTVAIPDYTTGRTEDYYFRSFATDISTGMIQCKDKEVGGTPLPSLASVFGTAAAARVARVPFFEGGCYNLYHAAIGVYVLVAACLALDVWSVVMAVLVVRRAGRYRDPNRWVVRASALLNLAGHAAFVGVWRGKYVVDLDHFIRASNPAASFAPHWPGFSAALQLASVGLSAAAFLWVLAADNSALWFQVLRDVAIKEEEAPTPAVAEPSSGLHLGPSRVHDEPEQPPMHIPAPRAAAPRRAPVAAPAPPCAPLGGGAGPGRADPAAPEPEEAEGDGARDPSDGAGRGVTPPAAPPAPGSLAAATAPTSAFPSSLDMGVEGPTPDIPDYESSRPGTAPAQRLATPPQPERSSPPEAKPSTPPEAKPSTPPEARPSTPPEPERSASPEARPSTPPEAKPSTPPEAKPSTPPEPERSASPEAAKPATPPEATPEVEAAAAEAAGPAGPEGAAGGGEEAAIPAVPVHLEEGEAAVQV